MKDCIFCKIANKEVPKEFLYEDEDVMVFDDVSPIKPVHVLIVPKKHVKELLVVESELGKKLIETAQKIIKKTNIEDKGYRLTINGGGAQFVDHLHFHLTGPMGKKAGW